MRSRSNILASADREKSALAALDMVLSFLAELWISFWAKGMLSTLHLNVFIIHEHRYCHVDYATVSGIRPWLELYLLYDSYDINCQYCKNWSARMAQFPNAPVFPEIRYCVPKFHLPTHKGICRWIHSFHLMLGVGETDGEDPERRWSKENAIARSTREMGPGHRHDTSNLHTGDYCFQKLVRIGKCVRVSHVYCTDYLY